MVRILLVGLQDGDEGKAAAETEIKEHELYLPHGRRYTVVARYSGGSNAGQTRVNNAGGATISHIVPIGVDYDDVYSVFLGGGAFYPEYVVKEIQGLRSREKRPGAPYDISPETLGFDSRLQVTLQYHLIRERDEEERLGDRFFDPTRNGISTTYTDAAAKMGIRLREFCNPESFERFLHEKVPDGFIEESDIGDYLARYKPCQQFITPFLVDRGAFMREHGSDDWILGGAQGFLLDVFDGTVPYTTSSSSIRSPVDADRRVGVVKLVSSRVGEGPLPAAMPSGMQDTIRGKRGEIDAEYGKRTGRPRRLAWMDTFAGRFAVEAADIDGIALTTLDKLAKLSALNNGNLMVCTGYAYKGSTLREFPDDRYILEQCEPVLKTLPGWDTDISGVREFSDLPANARQYVQFIADEMGVPWDFVKVGPDRGQVIVNSDIPVLD